MQRAGVVSQAGRPLTASQNFFNASLLPNNLHQIPDGRYTHVIYSLVKLGRYHDVVTILEHQLQSRAPSRPILSLLGYCYYQLQDYQAACQVYEDLCGICDDDDYKCYYAKALLKCGEAEKAIEACLTVSDPTHQDEVLKIKAEALFQLGQLAASKDLIEKGRRDMDNLISHGCLLYSEGDFLNALAKWKEAFNKYGYRSDLAYNIAIGFYLLKEYDQSLKWIMEIIQRALKEHPGLLTLFTLLKS
jgi:tetratricopeptide repeat protein 30